MSKRTGIQLAYPFEEVRLLGPGRKHWNVWPVMVQPKLDGIRCRVIFTENGAIMVSSEDNVIHTLPHITEFFNTHLEFFKQFGELDGELYKHGMPFEEIISIINRDNTHHNHKYIEFHCFDYIRDEGESNQVRDYALSLMSMRVHDNDCLKRVPTKLAQDINEVYKWLDSFHGQGYEGIMVRHPLASYQRKRVTTMMKFKPKKSDTYMVCGWTKLQDKDGNWREELGALVLRDPEGNEFNVGTGFTQLQRRELWEDRDKLMGKDCTINYQNLTERGVPRFSVFVSLG